MLIIKKKLGETMVVEDELLKFYIKSSLLVFQPWHCRCCGTEYSLLRGWEPVLYIIGVLAITMVLPTKYQKHLKHCENQKYQILTKFLS